MKFPFLRHTIDPAEQDTLEVGTYLRGAYPHAKLVIMGWHPGGFTEGPTMPYDAASC